MNPQSNYPKMMEMLYILGQLLAEDKASTMPADDVIAVTEIMPEWKEGAHNADSVVQYNGQPWRCLQTHDSTGNATWCPGVAPSLWGAYHATSADRALPWVAPTGAHDCYNNGEFMVWTDGAIYQSLIDGNVYSPEAYPAGWAVYSE